MHHLCQYLITKTGLARLRYSNYTSFEHQSISGTHSPLGVMMGQAASSRKTADVLRKTIEQLEADPTVDAQDPAFISLKCSLLARILELESNKAHLEAVIHLVEASHTERGAEHSDEDDSAIA